MALNYYRSAKPLIAAHRGLSSLYPENTLESFKQALKYSDFIELDVVLNQQGEVVVCHDPFLSQVSNIKECLKFSNKKEKKQLYGKSQEDWWINNFTLNELQEIKLHSSINQRKSEYDGMLSIPTLREVISELLIYNKENKENKGIFLEIKDYEYHLEYCNKNIAEPVLDLLREMSLNTQQKAAEKLPLVIMAFDSPILKYFNHNSNLPLVQLVWFEDKIIPNISDIKKYADIIGLDMRLVWQSGTTTEYYEEAKRAGLTIYGWTFQDDQIDLKNLFQEQDYSKIYKLSSTLLQGIITEFPQEAIKYIN